MGLSWQQGPLAPGAVGRFLVPGPLPERLLFAEPLRRRMRVRFGGTFPAPRSRRVRYCPALAAGSRVPSTAARWIEDTEHGRCGHRHRARVGGVPGTGAPQSLRRCGDAVHVPDRWHGDQWRGTHRTCGRHAQSDSSSIVISPDNVRLIDPFLIMGDEWWRTPGFDWHPHRGIETITIVLDGVLEHGDSLGNSGLLEAGDVQWMTAGRGVIHRELAFRNERVRVMQLWLNLPAAQKLAPTHYQDLRAGIQAHYTEPGVSVQVISGASGPSIGPASNEWPILGLMLTLDPATTYQQMLPASYRAFAHVISGRLMVSGRPVRAGQTAWSDPVATDQAAASMVELATPDGGEQTKVMLFAGQPLGEPVVVGGPFVMNSRAEIEQAFRDYHAGNFGPIPRLARIRDR